MYGKTSMITIPLKRGSDVEIWKPMNNLISSRFNPDEQGSYHDSINEFAKLRSSAAAKPVEYHEGSLDVLCRYYDQINALESKLPATGLPIPFKWKDAFEKGSIFGSRTSKTVSSFGFEKACILFNIAALRSQVASVQSKESDENLKLSAKLYQQAAGEFQSLKTWVMSAVGSEPTPDMQPDTLTALASVMVAQAQEIFANKAIQENMKASIIAKICSQCGDLYAEANRLMSKEILKPLWDKEWINLIAMKHIAFNGLAQYYQSLVCSEAKSVGEEISRLKCAIELLKSSETRSGYSGFVSGYIDSATLKLSQAEKDNDFIYHERVPDSKALSAVSRAVLAKPLPPAEKMSANFTDLFESLVPIQVQQALTQVDVRREDMVNREVGKLREATQLLNTVLASLNLPAMIEETASPQHLPPSISEKATAVAEAGGIQSLEKMMKELPELLQRNTQLLDECDRQIKEEADSDLQLRSQFGNRWTRTPSDKLTATFISNSTKYRKVIENATQADVTVRSKLEGGRKGMELLSGGPEYLAQALPAGKGAVTNSPAVSTLRDLMKKVEFIKSTRNTLKEDLEGTTVDLREAFLVALAADGAINEPALATEKIGEAFRDLQQQVSMSVTEQEGVIVAIQEAHEQLTRTIGVDGGERERLLKEVASSHDVFKELTENLNEGTRFYNDLTQLLVTFQGKISDFCFARRTEKEELLKDLTSGLANQSTGPAPQAPAHHDAPPTKAAPPPRPPPPSYVPPTTAPNPYQGAPPSAPNLPYPLNPPAGYPYPVPPQQPYGYPPMPQGYNPYYSAPPAPHQPYPTQAPPAAGAFSPYPTQPPTQWPQP